VAFVATVAFALAGCLPASTSTEGQSIGGLYTVFVVGGIVVATIVWGLTTWVLLRYRRRDDTWPTQTRGNLKVEVVWTTIPLITVVGLFVLTLQTLNTVQAGAQGAVQLQVTAFRWGWEATYPATNRTLVGTQDHPLEIVLPVDAPIEIRLESRDVNHAFFVPAFLFKRDAIAGRPSVFNLRIAQPGTYGGECAEYCGILHAQMPFTVRGVTASEFQSWLASAGGQP
jgi:cytochrome c oxidase subunit 2